ncbi:MAG: response regulator transcription factor [Chitinophagaceae bacterium]|nr:response regulator transcription factor [Chitinophagaceae bacterium]
MKLLIIEDERELAEAMHTYLSGNGFVCECVHDIKNALDKLSIYEYDCILLDLMLADGDGITLLRELRAMQKTDGVLIISARDTLDTKLEGLHAGADDYLTKPFHLPELMARVQAIIRRHKFSGNNIIRFNEINIDLLRKEVFVDDKAVLLTRKEFDLLLYLVGNSKRVLSKNAIAEHLSGDMADMMISFDFIYAHIKNLKKKLLQAGAPDYIKTVYGIGYKWTE